MGTHARRVKRNTAAAQDVPTSPSASQFWGDTPDAVHARHQRRLARDARLRSERRRALAFTVLLAAAGVLLLGGTGVAAAVRALGTPHEGLSASTAAAAQAPAPTPASTPAPPPPPEEQDIPTIEDSAAAAEPTDADEPAKSATSSDASKMVALTFDDGPSRNTAKVVEILREHKASATFFFVGRRMTKGAFDPGSLLAVGEIGNHTWWHSKETWAEYAYYQAKAEIEDTNSRIHDKAGTDAVWFRSVGLKRNDEVDRAVKDSGMKFVGGVLVDDWGLGSGNTADAITTRVTTLAAEDRSILILHETNNETVEALPGILDWYEEHGFQVVTVSKLMESE